jgi:hypothetical protein
MNYWWISTFKALGILAVFGSIIYGALWLIDPLAEGIGREGRVGVFAAVAVLGFFSAAFAVIELVDRGIL